MITTYLAVSAVEIIVGAVVALIVVGGFGLYLYRKIKAKKSGNGGCCSGDCCSCGGCSVLFKKKDDDKKDAQDRLDK